MISYPSASTSVYPRPDDSLGRDKTSVLTNLAPVASPAAIASPQLKWVFAAAVFLISVPVFLQAPLVRALPVVSLLATFGFILWGRLWASQPRTQVWGDLLIGFSLTWLAGSIYWGWLRWEPLLHLPVEAIGLPFALWGLSQNRWKVGNFFYLGSLFGTVVTDIFFYLIDLIPFWRTLMVTSEASAGPIFQAAIARIQTPAGIGWALTLATVLLIVGLLPLRTRKLHWWAFSGAVLSTILVDGLFWLAASAV